MSNMDEFRLAVLNPGGRDAEQDFAETQSASAADVHAPINFHAYAACTSGAVFRETKRAEASGWPVLLLLRGDFRATERALAHLQAAKRTVIVVLKETGAHQMAEQLNDAIRFARFLKIVRAANGALASTANAAALLRSVRGDEASVAFIPTPYPIDDENWNWSLENRAGIFIGTREFDVPSRHHLRALLAAKQLSEATREPVTVYNFERRRGARLIAEIGFRRVRVQERRLGYRAYLGEVSRHKIIFQLDRSRVPGQVAGDALLCRSVCVGGDGAIDALAFPDTCGENRTDDEITAVALELLRNDDARHKIAAKATQIAQEKLSFAAGREMLARFFAQRAGL